MAETQKTNQVKEKMVKVKIPKDRNIKNQPDEIVYVNDRNWQIQRGVEVEVPECVAEVLRNRERALDRIDAYEDNLANN